MKWIKFLSLPALLGLSVMFLFSNYDRSAVSSTILAQAAVTPTPPLVWSAGARPMPPELMYQVLFEEIALLQKEDDQVTNPKTAFKFSFYEERIKLKTSQYAVIDKVVSQYLEKSRLLDQRAGEIIRQTRANYPGGELKKKDSSTGIKSDPKKFHTHRYTRTYEPPAVPVELTELQKQKNQMILKLREKIKESFGAVEFSNFEAAIKENVESVLFSDLKHQPATLPPPTVGVQRF